MSQKIFISYHRDDSAASAIGISQSLENEFGGKNVFIDVDMRAGAKFPDVLETRLAECKVMLVLIGPGWIDARDEQGHRQLDNPDDWVRLEIAHALKRKITVIPVQINRARRCPHGPPCRRTSGACWIISPRRSRTPALATTWPDWSGTSGQFRLPGRGDGLWRSLRQWRRSSVSDS